MYNKPIMLRLFTCLQITLAIFVFAPYCSRLGQELYLSFIHWYCQCYLHMYYIMRNIIFLLISLIHLKSKSCSICKSGPESSNHLHDWVDESIRKCFKHQNCSVTSIYQSKVIVQARFLFNKWLKNHRCLLFVLIMINYIIIIESALIENMLNMKCSIWIATNFFIFLVQYGIGKDWAK